MADLRVGAASAGVRAFDAAGWFFVCRGEFGLGDDVFGVECVGQLVRQAPDQVRGALRYAASRLLRMSGLGIAERKVDPRLRGDDEKGKRLLDSAHAADRRFRN